MSGSGPQGPLTSADLCVKLFVEDPDAVVLEELIPVFHRWIGDKLIEDELLIDVASYAHVPKGPGVVLICDKAHIYFDVRHGRPGIRFRGRRDSDVTGAEGVSRVFHQALHAASLLEGDAALEGRYRFRTDELEFGIYDRLRAPSEPSTLDAVAPALQEYVRSLYGDGDVTLELTSEPKEPFMISVKTAASPTLEELLGQVAAASS